MAMMLVDWEENLGLGTEANGGSAHHPGDGGMVAVTMDATNSTVAITDENWKAQTFYTAPIRDLSCTSESGSERRSDNCSTADSNDDTSSYGLHWSIPPTWSAEDYDDSSWPSATTYTNQTIGVDNKPSYTTFRTLFDDPDADAQFIWSTNVILDNLVLVRYTVE